MPRISTGTLSTLVEAASTRLKGHVVPTPTIHLHWLDSDCRKIYAKLECHQHTGSFKYRGAFNAMTACSQPVITASAGNHGLALAAAAKRLGRESTTVVPVNASELKVKRLQQHGRVTLFGQDLSEAIKFAMGVAQQSGTLFISPYADINVAAGAGTAAMEAFVDEGPFDAVVVPLGGGGLAAGVGSWCRTHSPSTKVFCAHPAVFGRSFNSQNLVHPLSEPTVPTVADGLAVQLTCQTPFSDILNDVVESVIPVPEDEILQAIGALIRLESLLVEGAAAIGVAAISKLDASIKGRILLLLTGGNVAATDVARALVTDVPDPSQRRGLGLRNTTPSLERGGQNHVWDFKQHEERQEYDVQVKSLAESWRKLADRLQDSVRGLEIESSRQRRLSAQAELESDLGTRAAFDAQLESLKYQTEEFSALTHGRPTPPYWIVEERYRVLLQWLATLHRLFDRTSAANDQARREWFFNVECQSMTTVNYRRYGDSTVRSAEIALKAALNVGGGNTELLLTSSGMAAYCLLEAYILRTTTTGTRCVLPPYIYFEVLEQLQGLRHFEIIRTSSFDADELITTAEQSNARVVFIDPMANNVQLSYADIRHFANTVCCRPGWEQRIVIIDGTLVSGGMPVFEWFRGLYQPTVLYYESGTKYFQLGLDIQTVGVVVYPSKLDEEMRLLRRNMGFIMDANDVRLLPPIDSLILKTRLSYLSQNARSFVSVLHPLIQDIAEVNFPRLWESHGWRHGGALVTVDFRNPGLNNKEGLDACIEMILKECRAAKVPLVKGASFGFSTSRVSASSTMSRDSDPFLRFSVGIDPFEVSQLVDVTARNIRRYFDTFNFS